MKIINRSTYRILAKDTKGQTWIFYALNEYQQQFYGLNINPFLCWHRERLCGQKLRRIHATCFKCHLRLVVSGKLPLGYPISIQMIFFRNERIKSDQILGKLFCTLSEMFS